MVWTVTLDNVIKTLTSLSVDYTIKKDGVEIAKEIHTMQGDIIDLGIIKGVMLKKVNRMKGIDEKAIQIEKLKTKVFQLTPDGLDLVMK